MEQEEQQEFIRLWGLWKEKKLSCKDGECIVHLIVETEDRDLLRFLRWQFPDYDEALSLLMVKLGKVELLRWARAQDPPFSWNAEACLSVAISNKAYGVIELITSQEPTTRDAVTKLAASLGELEVMQWASAQAPPYSFNPLRCANACVINRHYHVLQWITGNSPEVAHPLWTANLAQGNMHEIDWLRAQTPAYPMEARKMAMHFASIGDRRALLWLKGQDADAVDGVCDVFVRLGRLADLRWAVAQAFPVNDDMGISAVSSDHFDMVSWARDEGFDQAEMCSVMAQKGKLEMLKWARGTDPPFVWRPVMCALSAATEGHHAVYEWVKGQLQGTAAKRRLIECVLGVFLRWESGGEERAVALLEAEVDFRPSREFCLHVAKKDKAGVFEILCARGCFNYNIRPGLHTGPRCARVAGRPPLSEASKKQARKAFEKEVLVCLSLGSVGIHGELGAQILLMAGLSL